MPKKSTSTSSKKNPPVTLPHENPIRTEAWLQVEKTTAVPSVCIVYGDSDFLRREALLAIRERFLQQELNASIQAIRDAAADADFSTRTYDGNDLLSWIEVYRELSTISMFGASRRLITVTCADDFLSKNREKLEDYLLNPVSSGILLLELNTLASNTRFYKQCVSSALMLNCISFTGADLTRWVITSATNRHNFLITREAASILVEQVGDNMGLLDQELAKLALIAPEGKPLSADIVRQQSGSWRTQTTWMMLDDVLSGNASVALEKLTQLLASGEAPIGILAQISSNLRRLAAAARIFLDSRKTSEPMSLDSALSLCGVNNYFIKKSRDQLAHIGRERIAKLLDWIVELDYDLKGDSAIPERLLLERFLLRLSLPAPSRR